MPETINTFYAMYLVLLYTNLIYYFVIITFMPYNILDCVLCCKCGVIYFYITIYFRTYAIFLCWIKSNQIKSYTFGEKERIITHYKL